MSINKTLFTFLCDAHLVEQTSKCQLRLFDWMERHSRGLNVDYQILGGDITHQPDPAQALRFLDLIKDVAPAIYLPGNKEGDSFSNISHNNTSMISGVTRLKEWPGYAFALATISAEAVRLSIDELIPQLPESGHVLILSHFHPDIVEDVERLLCPPEKPDLHVSWICGHRHIVSDYDLGRLRVHICAGLDSIKAAGALPEFLLCEWDGVDLTVKREKAPSKVLMPPNGLAPRRIGLAYQGTPEDLLETALLHGVSVIQFSPIKEGESPSPQELEMIGRIRQCPQSFLSVHLPNFDNDSLDFSVMEPSLQWARAVGIDDFTVHLPSMSAINLYSDEGVFAETPWSKRCRAAFLRLAEEAVSMGVQLSFENGYHKQWVPPAEEKLSVRPWHLLTMITWLRRKLGEKGYSEDQIGLIGAIFDVGHAYRDVVFSRHHTIAEWILALAPVLQLSHVHQVLSVDNTMVNHRAIADPCGPKVNYYGILPIYDEEVPKNFPLLLEIRIKQEALTSLRVLRDFYRQHN